MDISHFFQSLLSPSHGTRRNQRRRKSIAQMGTQAAVLEVRALLAAVTDAGDALNLDLVAHEQLSIPTERRDFGESTVNDGLRRRHKSVSTAVSGD